LQYNPEVTNAVNTVSKGGLALFNYLKGVDEKYELLEKSRVQLQTSYDSLVAKQGGANSDTLQKVSDALETTTNKIGELNAEYDLVGGGKQVLGVLGDLTEKVVAKALDLNTEYELTGKAKAALDEAINKVKK
tara:strand:+ start:464 stop:862 length:399 start_codon:yes stop_codon:yes gene_type:complete